MYFIWSELGFDPESRARLAQLLDDGGAVAVTYSATGAADELAAMPSSAELLVVPRSGTISPWSSKATDIAQVCGLDSVQRIERGTRYTLGSQRPLGRRAARAACRAAARSDARGGAGA